MPAILIISVLFIAILVLLISCIKIVPQSRVFVVERLGFLLSDMGKRSAFQGSVFRPYRKKSFLKRAGC